MNANRLLLLAILCLLPSCATVAGTVTGGLTGMVDAPAQVYRHNRELFEQEPINWPFNIVLMVPLGLIGGPIAGFGKGVALDVEWFMDDVEAGQSFGSYGRESVWRPYTLDW